MDGHAWEIYVFLQYNLDFLQYLFAPEMDKQLESSKILSLNLKALSSKLGLAQNEIQA